MEEGLGVGGFDMEPGVQSGILAESSPLVDLQIEKGCGVGGVFHCEFDVGDLAV